MPRTIKQEIFSTHENALSTLAAAFPEAVKDGEVDWETLKEILADAPSTGPERYELTWAGKAEAKREAGRSIVGRTLRFCPEESKDAGTTQNLFIEGDNLEVLKLLRENYYGAIKMIYIDPPYNTGNDFVYHDNFTQTETESELAEGNIDEDGQRLIKNPKSSNRYHADWLSMLYPRLRLARDFLSQDAVIFISIDDNEVHNLRKICDEIFGEENFIATIIWQKKYAPKSDSKFLSESHDYIVLYARNIQECKINRLGKTEKQNSRYKNMDNDPRGPWKPSDVLRNEFREYAFFPITLPNGQDVYPPSGTSWRYTAEKFAELIADNRIWFGRDGSSRPAYKRFLSEVSDTMPATTLWTYDDVGHSDSANKEIRALFDDSVPFDTPKPSSLIKQMLQIATDKDSIVLDFFAGSATTAHAVLQLNVEDGGSRKFIIVQIPETIDANETSNNGKYKTIADIGKDRIHRVGNQIKALQAQSKAERGTLFNSLYEDSYFDSGFLAFKATDTVIRWTHDALRSGEQMVLDEVAMSNKDRLDFMPGFTDLDVVYEIALRQNDVPLSAPVRPVPEAGKRTYLFADSILVCLEEAITSELVEALAAIQPTPNKFILRDSAFEDDIALKDEALRRLQACVARNTNDAKSTYVVDFI